MPVIQELIDFDKDFERLDPSTVIVLNDLPNRTEDDRAYFDWLVKETLTSDMVSVLPRCRCPEGKGGLKGELYLDMVCDICKSPVQRPITEDVRSVLWFRRPKGTEGLINPIVLIMLQKQFNKKGCNIMKWLIDRTYVPTSRPPLLTKMISDGMQRGLNNFIVNFDAIFAYLVNSGAQAAEKHLHQTIRDMIGVPEGMSVLEKFIQDHRHLIFCNYLPMINRMMLVLDSNNLGRFVESHVISIQDAFNTMLSMDRDFYDHTPQVIENRTAKILFMLCEYYEKYTTTNLRPKPGTYRKNVYGTRGNYSFRAVITSHDKIAKYDEVHIPWGVAVTTWWQHHIAVLCNRKHKHGGMTYNQATSFLMDHVGKYHPLLDEMFKDLISRSRYGKICSIIQRN